MTKHKNNIIPEDFRVYIKRDKNTLEIHDIKEKIIFIRPLKQLLSGELN